MKKIIVLLSLLLLGGAAFSSCGPDGSAGAAGAAETAEEQDLSAWDHISMKAMPDTPAETVQEDLKIMKERLDSYAGEERYVLKTSDPENENDAARIDIYLDPMLKGNETLTDTARFAVSAPIRFSLYDNETGYLDLTEDQFVDIEPSDISKVEVNGTEDPGITLRFEEAFITKNQQKLKEWKDRLILMVDVRGKTERQWVAGEKVRNWLLSPTQDPAVWSIDPENLGNDHADFLMEHLQKEPLAGAYAAVYQSAADWNSKELTALLENIRKPENSLNQENDSRSTADAQAGTALDHSNSTPPGSLLCTREELKASGAETVTITFYQSDRNMDDESRSRTLSGLCRRLDALGNPYCIGEVAGQKGTFVIETLPDHINEQVIDILQSSDPLNLTANVYLQKLRGGKANAQVVSLSDGRLALDFSLTMGGKDALHRMSLAQEELGGGQICICLHRDTPICAAGVEERVSDGHLVFDRNYTGIGGDNWNEENRWLLDLICAAINDGTYPPAQELGLIDESADVNNLFCREYFRLDQNGRPGLPKEREFSDERIVSEMLTALRSTAPDAEITDCSDFAEYVIRLNLDPKEAKGENKDLYLAAVYMELLKGPMINADVYLGSDDTECTSFRTYYSEERIRTRQDYDVAEEFYKQVMARIYEDNPALPLLERKMQESLQSIKETLRG